MSTLDPKEVFASCERFAIGHGRTHPREALAALAKIADPAAEPDRYGAGPLIESLERDVAALLGAEAAVFMPSGTMAQQIALRVWCDLAGSNRIAFHPTCHLELHEDHAYRELHGLEAVLVGPADRLMTIEDLDAAFDAAGGPIAALLVELPQREIGGQLPPWDELVALCERARERGARLHLDGARLWECGPYFGRAYWEIAGLFDTVYVSFYKGLGGIAGAALAGPEAHVAEWRVWQHRHGGTLISLYPYVLSARAGLEARLPRMGRYHEAAAAIAAGLRAVDGVRVIPDEPPTNMMHVIVEAPPERLLAAAAAVSAETGVGLMRALPTEAAEGTSRFELMAGDATLELAPEEIVSLYARAVRMARRQD